MEQKPAHGRKEADVNRKYYLFLLAVVVFAITYSIVFIDGPSYFGDDVTYLSLAYNVLHGHFIENGYIFSVRLMQIMPIALFYKLFGVNLITDSAWDITSFIGIIMVSFFMAKELFNERAGAIAATLAAFFPLTVVYSSTISEDVPLAFLTSLALLALLYGQKRNSEKWYMFCGILLVASFLVSPEAAVIWIIVIAYLIVEVLRKKIRIDKKLAHLAYGIAIALIVLMTFNYLNSQNPLVTFDVNLHFYSAVGGNDTIPSTNTNLMFYPDVMFPYNLYSFLATFVITHNLSLGNLVQYVYYADQNTSTGFYFYAIVASLLYLLARLEKKSYFAIFFLVAGFLYLEFGPMHISLSPFEYLPSYRLDRFLMIIAVPALVVMGIAIAKFIEDNPFRSKYITGVASVLMISFLIGTSVPINMNWHQVLVYERYDQMAISNYLLGVSNYSAVYFPNSDPSISIYARFVNAERFVAYSSFSNCSAFKNNSYVVLPINPPAGKDNVSKCQYWQLVLSPSPQGNFTDSTIYQGRYAIARLYYLPAH